MEIILRKFRDGEQGIKEKTCFFWENVLVNLFTYEIFYHKKIKCNHF